MPITNVWASQQKKLHKCKDIAEKENTRSHRNASSRLRMANDYSIYVFGVSHKKRDSARQCCPHQRNLVALQWKTNGGGYWAKSFFYFFYFLVLNDVNALFPNSKRRSLLLSVAMIRAASQIESSVATVLLLHSSMFSFHYCKNLTNQPRSEQVQTDKLWDFSFGSSIHGIILIQNPLQFVFKLKWVMYESSRKMFQHKWIAEDNEE